MLQTINTNHTFDIAALMKERGLNPSSVAKKLHVSRQTVYRWMSGEAPKPSNRKRVADLLGVTEEELLDTEAATSLSMERLVSVITMVESASSSIHLSPYKKAKMIAVLYAKASKEIGRGDEAFARALISLAE